MSQEKSQQPIVIKDLDEIVCTELVTEYVRVRKIAIIFNDKINELNKTVQEQLVKINELSNKVTEQQELLTKQKVTDAVASVVKDA